MGLRRGVYRSACGSSAFSLRRAASRRRAGRCSGPAGATRAPRAGELLRGLGVLHILRALRALRRGAGAGRAREAPLHARRCPGRPRRALHRPHGPLVHLVLPLLLVHHLLLHAVVVREGLFLTLLLRDLETQDAQHEARELAVQAAGAIEELQQRGDEEVEGVRVLVDEEAHAPEEGHDVVQRV